MTTRLRVSDIRSGYSSVWKHFSDAADAARLVVKASDGLGHKIVGEKKSIRVSALLYFSAWPSKSTSGKKKVDILVQADERFNGATGKIEKSTTRVGYFEQTTDGARPLLQLHYDFETPVPAAHPVFHAQLGASTWPTQTLAELGFRTPILVGADSLFGHHRIPTPFMGFGAALLAIAADHLEHDLYFGFLTAMRTNDCVLWSPACDGFLKSWTKHGGFPHSHHWY